MNYSVPPYECIKQQVVEEHMPPNHQAYRQWNGERFVRWAEQIGQHTVAVVRLFLSAHKVE